MTLSHIDELSERVRGTLSRMRGIVRAAVCGKPKEDSDTQEEDSATHDESPGLSALSEDEVRNIFWHACNPLEPRVALAFSSASRELWALTLAQRLQLRSNHEAVAALCHTIGPRRMRGCKKLREARVIECDKTDSRRLSAADLTMLGTLGPVLPALEEMRFSCCDTPHDGVHRLVAELGAGSLPAMTKLAIYYVHVGDAGAEALAALEH